MATQSFKALLIVGSASLAALAGSACGGTSTEDKGSDEAADGGTKGGEKDAAAADDKFYTPPVPDTGTGAPDASGGGAACGATTCADYPLPIGGLKLPGCCAEGDHCGHDMSGVSSFINWDSPPACAALGAPGVLSAECPDPPSFTIPIAPIPVVFKGCCTPEGKCGAMVDFFKVKNFGCQSSYPVDGQPASCDPSGNGKPADAGPADTGAAETGAEPGAETGAEPTPEAGSDAGDATAG